VHTVCSKEPSFEHFPDAKVAQRAHFAALCVSLVVRVLCLCHWRLVLVCVRATLMGPERDRQTERNVPREQTFNYVSEKETFFSLFSLKNCTHNYNIMLAHCTLGLLVSLSCCVLVALSLKH